MYNRLDYKEVQTFAQGRAFVVKHKESFSKMYYEILYSRQEIKIDKARAEELSREAGMYEISLPLVEVPWSSLSKKEQERSRRSTYKVMHEYYCKWNRMGMLQLF